MIVDDHAINSLRTWFDIAYGELKKEWVSGQYEELSHCPSFKATTAYREAMDVLIKATYQSRDLARIKFQSVREMLDEELEMENLRK